MFLIAVGDRAAKIAWFSQPRSEGGRIDWHTKNVAKLSGSMLARRNSQIEAVCADGLGRVLLLQETPPRVELIDPRALTVVASIDLAVEGRSEIARSWSDPTFTPQGLAIVGLDTRKPRHNLVLLEPAVAQLRGRGR
jgi:hypothetical protein